MTDAWTRSENPAHWVDPAEWRPVSRVTDASSDGEIQLRVVLHQSRRGLLLILGVAEFWARTTTVGGGVDYERLPGGLRFQFDIRQLVERLVEERTLPELRCLAALLEVSGVVEAMTQSVAARLPPEDHVLPHRAVLTELLSILQRGLHRTVAQVEHQAMESVSETRVGLEKIIEGGERLELFAGSAGAGVQAELRAAAERVNHIAERVRVALAGSGGT